MYRCNKVFDKNVKECMWILCQNCYDIRLEEIEKQEESQRKKAKIKGRNHAQDHHGDLEGMECLIAAQGMKLIFVVWNWMRTLFGSLKNTSKIGQNYTDIDGNPGRNLVDFSFQKYAMIVKEESQ